MRELAWVRGIVTALPCMRPMHGLMPPCMARAPVALAWNGARLNGPYILMQRPGFQP